jgi:DNA-binding response OmpR family regulator
MATPDAHLARGHPCVNGALSTPALKNGALALFRSSLVYLQQDTLDWGPAVLPRSPTRENRCRRLALLGKTTRRLRPMNKPPCIPAHGLRAHEAVGRRHTACFWGRDPRPQRLTEDARQNRRDPAYRNLTRASKPRSVPLRPTHAGATIARVPHGRSGQQSMRLLVVEDNEDLAGLLAKGLDSAGFTIDRVSNALEARTALATTRYAAVVLDLGLPDEDGLGILREIRSRNDPIPVVVLTARAGVRDRVNGLRSGADDYLVKPFAFEELVARLEAVLRRPGRWLGSSLRVGNLVFDTEARQAFIDEQPQALSAREVAVLELLMRRHGRVVTKKLVEDQLFGLSGEVASNAVEVYVHRLRKQLAEHGAKVQIHTMRGLGYLITEDK